MTRATEELADESAAITTTERGADGRALVTLIVLIAIVAWNRLSFDAWLSRMDMLTFFLPWYAFLGERLRDVAVPGWNPHLFSGAPFAGDPESGWMYAPAMLFFSLFTAATTAFKGMVVFQLAVAALSTYAFARVLGMGAMASLVAAVVYLVGPFLHWNTHCCLIFSQFATWIPLVLLGIELALRAGQWRERLVPWCVGAFAVSQMFAGWIGEGWLYAVLLPAAYIGYRTLLSPPPSGLPGSMRARLIQGVATGLGIVGGGMALAAAGMLPRYAINAETNLAGGSYDQLGEAGILNPPWSLDYLLLQTLGSGYEYHFRAAAFGGAAVILSLLALPMARQRFAAPFFAALTLIAMLLTLDSTPLHQLFSLIPRWREFHEHDAWRTISLAAIGPAMLSGAAIESLAAWRGRKELLPVVVAPLLLLVLVATALWRATAFLGWAPLIAATLTTVLMGIAVWAPCHRGKVRSAPLARYAGHDREDTRPSSARALTPLPPSPSALGEGEVDLERRCRRGDEFARFVPALVLVVAFIFPTGLELAGSWLGLPREGALWRHLSRDPEISAALAIETGRNDPGGAGEFLQEQLAQDGPFRYVGYGGVGYPGGEPRRTNYMEHRLDPNVQAFLVNGRPIFLGLYDIQGYNPLQLSRYVEFMAALNGAPQDYHTAFLLPGGVRSPLLDLLDVRYMLVDASLPEFREDVIAIATKEREVFRTPWVIVYEREPNPVHAWIVHDVRQVARGEALLLLASGTVNPYQTGLVEGTPPEVAEPGVIDADAAEVVDYQPDSLTIETQSTSAGLLVVSEIYEAGWRAYVDGEPAELLPTDHALRGVPLPAGEHSVEMRYEPTSLRAGLVISGVTLAAMLIVFAVRGWSAIRRRRVATG